MSKRNFDEKYWDGEIDTLLDSIFEAESSNLSCLSEETGSVTESSNDNNSSNRNRTLQQKKAQVFNLQNKGNLPSRRKNRKLRQHLLRQQQALSTYIKPTMRVMKRDIRKQYTEMFINVINNHDKTFLNEFLSTFCLPNCFIYDPRPNGVCATIQSKPCYIKGIEDITNIWSLAFSIMPDFIFQLKDCLIYALPNHSRSRIVSKVSFQGTKVFDLFNDLQYFSTSNLSSFLNTFTSSLPSSAMTTNNLGDFSVFQQFPQVLSILDLFKDQLNKPNSIDSNNNNTIKQEKLTTNKENDADDDISMNSLLSSVSSAFSKINGESQSIDGNCPPTLFGQDPLSIMNLISNFQSFNLLSQPITYKIEGVLTTFLDESNRITKFEFDCLQLKQEFSSFH